MKSIYPIFLLLLIFTVTETVDAQYQYQWRRYRKELVGGIVASNFLGDLGGANVIGSNGLRDLDWPATRPGGSFGYRYRTGKSNAVKGMLHIAYLSGDDQKTQERFRNNRNLNFRTPIIELSGQFEWLLTRQREGHRYKLKGVQGWRHISFESYVFIGAGLMWFNPQGRYTDGNWVNLKPLNTEGQGLAPTRKPYHRVQPVIPVGLGIKYAVNPQWSVGIEYGIRKTFTDYIDDCSSTYYDNNAIREAYGDIAAYFADPNLGKIPGQTNPNLQRGDPTDNDTYMFAEITVYYKLQGRGFSMPKF